VGNPTARSAESGSAVSPEGLAQLADWCRRNIVAMIRGQVAAYYLPGGEDGNVPGVAITVHVSGQTDPIVERRDAPAGGRVPLQSTLFGLAERVAKRLASAGATADRWPELRVEIAVSSI
jgi:hypothetical protein